MARLHHDLCKLIQDKDNELQLMRGVKRSMETDTQTITSLQQEVSKLRAENKKLLNLVVSWEQWYDDNIKERQEREGIKEYGEIVEAKFSP